MIRGPVEKFFVAKISTSGVPTTLQTFIKDAVREHVEETRSESSLLASSAGTGRSGEVECVKKATLSSVLDINGDVRAVYSKAGGSARMKQWAALVRAWDPARLKALLGLDYDASIEDIRDAMLSESERVLEPGDAMFSLSRLDSILRLEAWKNEEVFRSFLLLELPVANWKHSLMDFKEPEHSAWTMDCDPGGRDNLLQAVMNWGNFVRVVYGNEYSGCAAPIRHLFEDSDRCVTKYQNAFLQCQLEWTIRRYAQEMTKTPGRRARICGGLALGGQGESVALLQWCVGEFVALVRGGTLEAAPHTQFYASAQYTRVRSTPVAWDIGTAGYDSE